MASYNVVTFIQAWEQNESARENAKNNNNKNKTLSNFTEGREC